MNNFRIRSFRLALIATLMITALSCQNKRIEADRILFNARIVGDSRTMATFEAMAIGADTIIELGSNRHIMQYQGPTTRMTDAGGRL